VPSARVCARRLSLPDIDFAYDGSFGGARSAAAP
jgi:hypothetical protein